MAESLMPVQVCYASPIEQRLVSLNVPVDTTIAEAVRLAMPDIDLGQHRVGIFSKLKTPQTVLREHDRVELYRPLLADPKESRRKRAKSG
ncbi:RnfH family protein [Actimicrobium sp. CCI2.3]|uniref:RnfH family protein n=1 Tax=Actimicrobium sp. CCI2.3 TaxID=3048616 RepID=UPI002AB43D16|nr:RnfH family protein [Actimicrobium sp. CCI2.3]MDY7572818.1 RnfH family protein [Actimicrobium sp. CCI2.3]MEB0020663.1 RnfH family protein [Actimicrobium sp. CCI2.3]